MNVVGTRTRLIERSADFITWLDEWYASLAPQRLDEVITDPARVAICSVDLINGFCYEGNLASPRVGALVSPIVDLFQHAHALGVRNFLLVQEWHSEHAQEFQAFGPHGIRNTREAQTVPELARLPFADDFHIFHKNSIHTITGTQMESWLAEHPEVDTYIVVGDCTDLCVHDMATDLKMRANAEDRARRVVVPANAVNTYDVPVSAARTLGILPHDGEFLHVLFLYQMALNGIQVVKQLI